MNSGLISKDDVWGEIGEVIANKKPGRQNPDEITIFDSTGLAIQDAITAWITYKKALREKMGRFIEIM